MIKIGIVDSGVGGITVLKRLVAQAKCAEFIYCADTANLPYGDKNKEQIASYIDMKIELMILQKVDILIIACNTSDAVLSQEQFICYNKRFKYGIIRIILPTVLGVLQTYQDVKRIGIMSTAATVKSMAYERTFVTIASKHDVLLPHIISVPCPDLVPWIESGMKNTADGYALVSKYIDTLIQSDIDTLIYGCTHYPLIADIIKDVVCKYKKQDITLIDPAYFVVENVMRALTDVIPTQPSECNMHSIKFFVTDNSRTKVLRQTVVQLIGYEPDVSLVALNSNKVATCKMEQQYDEY